jgi:starch synthase
VRIHFAAAELAPLVQSGGLGDAVTGLALALAERGHTLTCVVPAYRRALASPDCPPLTPAGEMRIALPDGELEGRWLEGWLAPSVRLRLLDLPELYDRPGLYGEQGRDYPDNPLRYIALSRAAAYLCEADPPDALVAHDWHAALAVATLRTIFPQGASRRVATVQAVHNNAYQGRCPPELYALTGLPPGLYHPDGVEAWGKLCLLKAGIRFADRIVAVSPGYAREIQRAPAGEGLEGAYTFLAHRLSGISNGIDTKRFDPATDAALPATFSAEKTEGKASCRAALLAELGLARTPPGRLCVSIGRFAQQKGWDVLADAVDALVAGGATLALLGSGDAAIAANIGAAAARHPRRVALRIGFDDALARRLYAAADAVLIPSRFEPCGLVQMIAQRYGALPVAHRVGGLSDSIAEPRRRAKGLDWSQASGILFSPLSVETLVSATAAVATLADAGGLPALQRRLLGLDVSWRVPAMRWEHLLQSAARDALERP